jgi:hypothetical protein
MHQLIGLHLIGHIKVSKNLKEADTPSAAPSPTTINLPQTVVSHRSNHHRSRQNGRQELQIRYKVFHGDVMRVQDDSRVTVQNEMVDSSAVGTTAVIIYHVT